jgi:hypothetical protein
MSGLTIAIILGTLIILVLSVTAGHLTYKVYLQKKDHARRLKAQEAANQQALSEQRVRLNKSIQILAQAVHKDELTLTEASIRICGLLDSLDVPENIRTEFSAFYQLREKTSHIPYLEAWHSLSNAEQKKFDLERLRYESTFNDFVMDAAKRIQGRNF